MMPTYNILLVFFLVELLLDSGILIGKDLFPSGRDDSIEPHFGLEVRLVETRKHLIGLVGLELCVEVLFFVDIDKTSTPVSIIVVLVFVRNGNSIFALFELVMAQPDETFGLVNLASLRVEDHF